MIQNSFQIRLDGANTQGYRGRYSYNLIFKLTDFEQTYSFPFDVIIGSSKLETDEEIRAAINIAPEFAMFTPG